MPTGVYKRSPSKMGQEQPNMINQKFERLLVINYDKEASKRGDYYQVRCDCSNKLVVSGNHLRTGHTKSCGCLQRETASKLITKFDRTCDRTNENGSNYSHGLNSRAAEEHRELIRRRDHYKCQRCSKTQKENGRRLDVHHLDDNHYNDDPENEVSLCRKCHIIVTRNRNVWRPQYHDDSNSKSKSILS